MFFFQRIRSSLFFTSRSSFFSVIQVNVDIKIMSKERIGFVVGVLYLQRSGPLIIIIIIIIIILLWDGFGEVECNENFVSDHPQFCSVRILFTNATLPYTSHIIGVLNCSL